MARTIIVDPKKLQETANRMEGLTAEYDKLFRQLYREVDGMAAAWQGADNIAYTGQIKGFEADFLAMSSMMKQFSEFLKYSAKLYNETQNDVINQSKKLAI